MKRKKRKKCKRLSGWIRHFQKQSNTYRMMIIENCKGWLAPGGHSSGSRALTAKVKGPWLDPRWLLVKFSIMNYA